MTSGPFRLYPVEQHWCSFADYGAILSTVRRIGAKSVLEFGPGSSTLALIEGGATRVDACEDDPHWAAVARERIVARFPEVVRVHLFDLDDLLIPSVNGRRYDLALIDGPKRTASRPAWIEYAASLARHVLVPLELDDGGTLAGFVASLANALGRPYERTETGPLAGAYGLIGPAC